jgi:hypothetical protein
VRAPRPCVCLPPGATPAPRPRDHALTRHGHRRLPRRAMADARLATVSSTSQARTSGLMCVASPLGPAGFFARPWRRPLLAAALALGASSDLGVAQPSMRCTQWPSRRRARSPSAATSCSEMTFPRMLPAGSRGGASTTTVRSCAHETRAPACLPPGATPAPRPRDHALTRHGHRRLPRRAMADARLATVSSTSQARTTGLSRRASPLGPAGGFAQSSRGSSMNPRMRRSLPARAPISAMSRSRNPRCDARSGRHATEHGRRAPRLRVPR